LLVGSLDHVDEVEVAECGPLRLDGGAELLHLAVDLTDTGGVVLDRLHPFRGEGREHDVGRHRGSPSRWASGTFTCIGSTPRASRPRAARRETMAGDARVREPA